jgi:hypothetical protein
VEGLQNAVIVIQIKFCRLFSGGTSVGIYALGLFVLIPVLKWFVCRALCLYNVLFMFKFGYGITACLFFSS